MEKNISTVFPITMTVHEARKVLENSELRGLVDQFAIGILEKKPTPLEAQAVLVTTWETVLRNARFSLPNQQKGTEKFQSQT